MWGLLGIGLGGAFGSLSRYFVNIAAYRLFGSGFPFGTLIANVAGCLLIGLFIEYDAFSGSLPKEVKLWVITGFLGAFTTFSAFGMEAVLFLEQRSYGLFITNILANVLLGLGAVLLGLYLGRILWGA